MAFTVNFYTFSKRINSTAVPNNPVISVQCTLKDNSGIINPVLEITTSVNPQALNYAYIPQFDRYYWVNDWTWILGRWEVTLNIDALGTYRSQIGASSHYVLRSSYRSNPNIIDELYPVLAWQPNYYVDTVQFNWTKNISLGKFILGVANNNPNAGFGALDYYILTLQEIRDLIHYMLPQPSDAWTNGFSGMTDILYRSIYGPFDYIKSCKWLPYALTLDGASGISENIRFGNYTSNVTGQRVLNNVDLWLIEEHWLELPTGWLSLTAKYRSTPYANIFIVFNPFGVIELNPQDFTDSRTVVLQLYYDIISGTGLLKIYKRVGTTNYFITEISSSITVDIPLSNSNIDATGLFSSIGSFITSSASVLFASNPIGAVAGSVGAIASAGNAGLSMGPTIRNSHGNFSGNIRSLDGEAVLIYQSSYFASEDNNENGLPLCETVTLNTIPGFIKCLHGEISIDGAYNEELSMISEFLTNGFFME